MKKTPENPTMPQNEQPATAPHPAGGTVALFNALHQPIDYTLPDGTTKTIAPKSRVSIARADLTDVLKVHLRTGALLDETPATE